MILDDRDIFYDQDLTEVMSGPGGIAPKWCSLFFLAFNLLGARGVYYNLLHLDVKSVILSSVLWGFTFGILVFHNRFYKKLDRFRDLGFPYHT